MRLRPATDRDAGSAKELRNKRKSVFARVEDNMALLPEDEIRISIEPSFSGYLYVIDRELYDGGSMGRPLLIFPTLLTYGGDNYVEPGEPRVIPDPVSELKLIPNNMGGKVQIAERLTIIISPTRLSLPHPLGTDEMELPSDLVEQWERDWGQQAIRRGVPATVNQGQTVREQAAGRAQAKELRNKNRISALNERDPLPQNVYQLKVDPRAPSLIIVPLRLKGAAKPNQ